MAFDPHTLLSQLGGNKFIAMVWACNLAAGEKEITFSIWRWATNGINRIVIEYDEKNDLYTMKWYKLRGTDLKLIDSKESIYADYLQKTFTAMTGLNTSL